MSCIVIILGVTDLYSYVMDGVILVNDEFLCWIGMFSFYIFNSLYFLTVHGELDVQLIFSQFTCYTLRIHKLITQITTLLQTLFRIVLKWNCHFLFLNCNFVDLAFKLQLNCIDFIDNSQHVWRNKRKIHFDIYS